MRSSREPLDYILLGAIHSFTRTEHCGKDTYFSLLSLIIFLTLILPLQNRVTKCFSRNRAVVLCYCCFKTEV